MRPKQQDRGDDDQRNLVSPERDAATETGGRCALYRTAVSQKRRRAGTAEDQRDADAGVIKVKAHVRIG